MNWARGYVCVDEAARRGGDGGEGVVWEQERERGARAKVLACVVVAPRPVTISRGGAGGTPTRSDHMEGGPAGQGPARGWYHRPWACRKMSQPATAAR